MGHVASYDGRGVTALVSSYVYYCCRFHRAGVAEAVERSPHLHVALGQASRPGESRITCHAGTSSKPRPQLTMKVPCNFFFEVSGVCIKDIIRVWFVALACYPLKSSSSPLKTYPSNYYSSMDELACILNSIHFSDTIIVELKKIIILIILCCSLFRKN